MEPISIHHGDCLEVMKDIPDKSVDMVLCDLPYGVLKACRWDTVIPFEPLWGQYERIVKKDGVIVLFGSQPFTSALVMSNPRRFKYQWVWNKVKASGHLNAKLRPMLLHEDVLVFSYGRERYFPQGLVSGSFKNSRPSKSKLKDGTYNMESEHSVSLHGGYPKSIVTFSKPSDLSRLHPTQKPVELLEYLIRTYTLEGDVVLDNCMGSGSTGVACINTSRKFIGIKVDPTYFESASKRLLEVL